MSFSLSEFLAEESEEKFWDFVEANQNIEGEYDGKCCFTFSLQAAALHSSPVCEHLSFEHMGYLMQAVTW